MTSWKNVETFPIMFEKVFHPGFKQVLVEFGANCKKIKIWKNILFFLKVNFREYFINFFKKSEKILQKLHNAEKDFQ